MDRVLLSTYVIKILDNRRNEQTLSLFNGQDDFLTIFNDFLNDIFQNILGTTDTNLTSALHLTLDTPPTLDTPNRRIYGYFSSGVSGEEYDIRDLDTNQRVLEVTRNHAAFRNLFFYIHIPTGRNRAALILQRKAKFGIKTIFTHSLNRYFREQGYSIYRLQVDNILHGRVYRRMMDSGNLKKVEFIKKRIPLTIEEYYSNGEESLQIPGTLKTSMLSSTSLPQEYKRFINDLFTNPDRERIEIAGIDEEFDEVEFELELNGKKKTFYIENRSRIQPDIDVTSNVELVDGVPTLESLIAQSEELINEIVNNQPRS